MSRHSGRPDKDDSRRPDKDDCLRFPKRTRSRSEIPHIVIHDADFRRSAVAHLSLYLFDFYA
jgi:hypothetical protein